MKRLSSGARLIARAFFLVSASALSSPGQADHLGPGAVGGGGMNVFGPETLDDGRAAASFRLLYTRPDQRSDEELETLAESHVHAHNTDYNLNASAGVAYGITHHLTVSAELPFVRRDDLREGTHGHAGGVPLNGVEELGSVSGFGDLNLLAKYRVTEGEGVGLALVAGIKAPTGSTHKKSSDGERLETEHQLGTGSWDPLVGASIGTTAGPLRLSASWLYQFSGKGAQETTLGDRFQGGVAISHRFAPTEHHHAETSHRHHGDELEEQQEAHAHDSWTAFVELGGEWEGRQRVDGQIEAESGGSWIYAAPGVRFNASSGWSAGASLAWPLWQDIRASHPDNRYRLMLSLGRSL